MDKLLVAIFGYGANERRWEDEFCGIEPMAAWEIVLIQPGNQETPLFWKTYNRIDRASYYGEGHDD